ncbi:glycosyltransferase family 4 protein [Brevibacillus brevis]|uniref:glycosyltransferase family 4 protein n=1 Tax=Brevibacillus brevis TaxID=1393 RepID=UPI000D105486|nr:glycosyltransferase family 4 protein [Brevibacillus brevis]PSJ70960.1 glycosyltransferase family 1 protein [Brevibacillus brevis]RED24315.1 spore coat protein SA [Brevibacillus brevis]VEF91854.1 Spore coat protein SA [Brevibacillus brevis]
MKIVIIAPEQIPVPPILGGSVEITILAIAKELSKWHSVSIISRAHPRYPKYSVIDGVQIYRVPTGSPAKYLTHVKKILKKRRFDVLQIDNRPEFVRPIKSMFPKATVSLYLHSLTFVNFPHTSRAETLAGLRKADLIITNSSSLESRLSARFPSMSRKIRVAWLGVDTSRFSPIQKTSYPRAFTLLFAGRLIPRKGVPILLQAAKLVNKQVAQPVKVMIAGGSSTSKYARQLQALSRKFGVHAEFLGTIPHCRIHRVFRKADLFICPSQKHESFGLVNVEAMSSGLPVVASKNGGIKEVIQHGRSGLLINQYKNPQAFADAICSLIMNRPLYLKMKQEARQIALEKFSWRATADRLNQIYESEKALQKNELQNEDHNNPRNTVHEYGQCLGTISGGKARFGEVGHDPEIKDVNKADDHSTAADCHECQDLHEWHVHDWSCFDDCPHSITSTRVFQNVADLCTENDESDGSDDSTEASFDFFSAIGYQRLVDALIYG